MSKLSNFIATIAPTVASALGSPVAGLAVSLVGKAFGMSEPTKDGVESALVSGNLTGDQISALKMAELDLQKRLKELGIEHDKLDQLDRVSARDMQTATRSKTVPLLAGLITLGYFSILIGLLTGDLKLWDNSGLTMLIGALTSAWGMVVSFYFGSSHSQDEKKA
jgi:hypothetical protein